MKNRKDSKSTQQERDHLFEVPNEQDSPRFRRFRRGLSVSLAVLAFVAGYLSCFLSRPSVPLQECQPFPATGLMLLTKSEKVEESKRLLEVASTFSAEKGEGRFGWLYLLASYAFDRSNKHIVTNLVENYLAVNYGSLAYSVFVESNITEARPNEIIPTAVKQKWSTHFENLCSEFQKRAASLDPGKPCSSILFSTVIGKWNLRDFFANKKLNQEIYDTTIRSYLQLQKKNPKLSSTDLNHQFFRVQMQDLDESNSFWNPLSEIQGFTDLALTMRFAAMRFLRDSHGWDEGAAMRKASHELIVWLSVHTESSTHQPHVTEDALVGGVYYVNIPDGSGPLDLYDPRGKHPIYGLQDPVAPPEPPFHRIHSIAPEEGLLVLFPGWLVHSVRSPSKAEKSKFQGKYRVSMSLNLKGEWIDTAMAGFGCHTNSIN